MVLRLDPARSPLFPSVGAIEPPADPQGALSKVLGALEGPPQQQPTPQVGAFVQSRSQPPVGLDPWQMAQQLPTQPGTALGSMSPASGDSEVSTLLQQALDLLQSAAAQGQMVEAEPASALAQALATGDFSQLTAQDLMALITMLLGANNPANAPGGGGGGGSERQGRSGAAGAHRPRASQARSDAPAGGGPAAPTAGQAASLEDMKARTPPDLRARAEAVDPSRIAHYDKRSPEVQWGARVAVAMGLKVTDTTDGHPGDKIHSKSSNHYDENFSDGQMHAIDIGGDPTKMAQFFDTMSQINPGKELFYDPRGALKNGRRIAAVGGHGDHVHYAA